MTLAELRWFIRRHAQDSGSPATLTAVTPEVFAALVSEILLLGDGDGAATVLDASTALVDEATVRRVATDADLPEHALDLRSLSPR